MLSIDVDPVVFPTSNRTAYRVTYFPIVSYSQGEYPDMEAPLDGGHRVGDYHIPIAHSEDGAPDPFPHQVVFDCEVGSPITRLSWPCLLTIRLSTMLMLYAPIRRVIGVKASFPVVQRVFRLAQELSSGEGGSNAESISPHMVFGGDGDEVEDWDVEDYDEGEGDLDWFNSFFFSSTSVQDSVRRSCRVVSDVEVRCSAQISGTPGLAGNPRKHARGSIIRYSTYILL
ncbi:uncharacterized protein EV420DRAFT_1761209 [Desarmillaria tabescens]|uniref:Uncharacterized protein n=1 Tax=Armillaria tabescens TaxID=1929756 RepID=A0AA39T3Y3_ARMTA|nr:uncharacterized protein EV420DRAFT_1761209 [Desarmillaria tabescens]KAK0462836.1 hypothetical protein EV420DRAFT_1761209 [Desarmillaria tabescens]